MGSQPLYKKVRRVRNWLFLRRAYEKAAAENPALERIFAQERDQANVQMTLNSENYTLASEPKSNLYGALYSVLATDDPSQRKSMHYVGCWHWPRGLPDGQSREFFAGQAAQAV